MKIFKENYENLQLVKKSKRSEKLRNFNLQKLEKNNKEKINEQNQKKFKRDTLFKEKNVIEALL